DDDKYNMDLSEKRAKACADYIIKKGVASSRISSMGFGESMPVGDNKTAEGRKLNRRTEFIPVWR
ncbi:MAG: OmpA family protein, partial [Saprospiraceae bacterium]